MNSKNWSAPNVLVLIAQLVEHYSASADAMNSNPVEVPKFFSDKFATASIAITTAATIISLFKFVFLQFTSSPQT